MTHIQTFFARSRFVIMFLSLFFLWSSTVQAQAEVSAFFALQNARNQIVKSKGIVKPAKVVNQKALDLARQALDQSFDFEILRKNNPSINGYLLRISTDLASEFVRESQLKASQNDWASAMNARLDALELSIKLAPSVAHASFAVSYITHVEGVAMKEIFPLVSHLDGASAQALASRLDAIEADRADWFDLLEKTRVRNLRETERYFQKPDWRKRIVEESMHYELLYPRVLLDDVKDVSESILQKEVEQLWDIFLKNARRPLRTKKFALGFKPHEAAFFLFQAPISDSQEAYYMARTETLLLSCTLKLREIHEKTGVYPLTFNTPIDPFGNGAPLVYQRTHDSYKLRSVGPNGHNYGSRMPQ